MANESFAELLRSLELRLAGVKARADRFAALGVDQAWVQQGEQLLARVKRLDEEQEALKAALAAKTAVLDAERKAARDWRSRTDKRIRNR